MAQSFKGFGDIFCHKTEINVHFKFYYNDQIFLPENIVKCVLWDVAWTYLIRIEFSFMD